MKSTSMHRLHYFSVSGFSIVYLEDPSPISVKSISDNYIDNWKFLLLARKIISYPIVFKTITDHCRDGLWYVKIFFYEIRDKPLSLIVKILDPKTILLFDSRPEPRMLMKRILAGPRYSNSVVLLAKLPLDEPKEVIEEVQTLSRIARKLYLELSPLTFSRDLGRLVGLKLGRRGDSMEVVLCVDKEGVSTTFSHSGLTINILSLSKCI